MSKSRSASRPPIVIAWVDQGIGEVGMHKYIKDRFEVLSPLVSQWFYFDSGETFTAYAQNHPDVHLISVMSGSMTRLLLPVFARHGALQSVYVFCADIDGARQATQGEPKVKGIFTVEDELYEQMASDLARFLLEEGLAFAQLDERSLARRNYEEAKRLITMEAKNLEEYEKRARIVEIDGRLDQLLA